VDDSLPDDSAHLPPLADSPDDCSGDRLADSVRSRSGDFPDGCSDDRSAESAAPLLDDSCPADCSANFHSPDDCQADSPPDCSLADCSADSALPRWADFPDGYLVDSVDSAAPPPLDDSRPADCSANFHSPDDSQAD
jgi:hypothetical protein